MTGNQIKGIGFRGALRYNLEKVEKGVAEILDYSFVSAHEKSIMKEVQLVRALRPNLQKFFYHTSINFPPHEDLSNEKMKAIGNDYLHLNGFDQHQFIMFRHHDADHPHLHILVNRIGYDGKVLSDSNDFARSEKVLRQLEGKYNLTKVKSSSQAAERAMTKNELEMMKRTNTPSQKMQLQVLIKEVLNAKDNLSCKEFIEKLEAKGIHLLFNQASTGYVSGISYNYQGFITTGAKLGNDFKWTSIKNTINYEQERDRQTIHRANARTKSLHSDTSGNPAHPSGDPTTLQPDRTNQQSKNTRAKPAALLHARPGNKNGKPKQPVRPTPTKDNRSFFHFPEKSKGLDPAALLDGHRYGDTGELDHQPDLDPKVALRLKKKKKRKGLSR